MSQVRCKMIVVQKFNSVSPYVTYDARGNGVPPKPTCSVRLCAVHGDDNATWSKYTPSGSIELQVTNPVAYDAFVLGESYFVDFTRAPALESDEVKP